MSFWLLNLTVKQGLIQSSYLGTAYVPNFIIKKY